MAKKKKKAVKAREPKEAVEFRRNIMLKQRVQEFTDALQKEITQYGIKGKDLTVTVHLQIKT
jgi:hypothetical protein